MNSKIKNLILIIIVLLVGTIFLTGCVGKKENGGETTKTESLTDVLAKAKNITSFKYDMIVTAPGQTAVTQKMWLKEKKMRMEMTSQGQNLVYLVDMNELLAYLYTPAENMAMKMNFSKAQQTVGESPTEQSGSVMQYNPVTLGTEVLDGKTCLVIEYTSGTDKTKMWVWTKYGLPIKTETTTAQGKSIVELKNIEFGDISDSMFELPAGVQIMQIPSFGF